VAALMRDQCGVREFGTSCEQPIRLEHQGAYVEKYLVDPCHETSVLRCRAWDQL